MRGQVVGRGLVACGLLCLAACGGCNGDHAHGSFGSSLNISLAFTPPPANAQDLVWIAEGPSGAGTLEVDLLARDITGGSAFDAFNVEISFDPLVAQASTVTSGGVLDGCAGGLPVVKVNNLSDPGSPGFANTIGRVIFAEAIVGSTPGCTVSGERPLGRFTFRAWNAGSSPLSLIPCSNADPSNPAGTCFFLGRNPAQLVPVTLFDSTATIEVTP